MDKAAAEKIFTPAALESLKAFPITPAELSLVSLSENVTFRVTNRNDGDAYVLRLHRPGYHSLEELNSERMWIRALADSGIAVPTPLAARDGRDYVAVFVPGTGQQRYAGMSRWIEGELLADVLRHNENVGVHQGYFEQLGSIVASMHNQASVWRAPASFKRHALDTDGLMGDAPFWGPFWEHPALSRTERRLLLATRESIRDALQRYGRHPATYSIIHADLHPGNLLVNGDRLTVIDFDDAGFGWHQYDIAVALFNYRTPAKFAAVERAFVRGYRTVRVMPDAALALIQMFLLIRGMAIIGWIHQRPELDRSQFLNELKDVICTQCATFESPC